MTRLSLDTRDFAKPAKTTREPLAALVSARAVTAAKEMDPEGGDWPYPRYPRQDWTACK